MRNEHATSRNARALKRLQERRKKRVGGLPKVPLGPRVEATASPSPALSETLVLTFPHKERGRWLTVPMAASIHLLVLAALVLIPIFFPNQEMEPHLIPLFLNAAPPPPPPLKGGDPMLLERASDAVPKPQPDRAEEGDEPEDTSRITDRMVLPRQVPDEILKPDVDIAYGVEEGFEFGDPLGMEGGIPGGVVGGVPGGVIGGIIGGTGTQGVPQTPDVGPRPVRMPRPSYTVEAIRKKISGEVVLQALIDVRGKVKVLKILRSIPELDTEAVRVVEEEWLFRPAMKSGRPVPSLAELVVTFNLY